MLSPKLLVTASSCVAASTFSSFTRSTNARSRSSTPRMRSVTGTGCMLSVLTGAFVGANPEHPLEAALGAVCAMGLCGEIAEGRMQPQDGTGSFRVYLMDAVSNLTPEALEEGADYEYYR